MMDEPWRIDDRTSLGARIERALAALERHRGARCSSCSQAVCGHAVVFHLVAGEESMLHCPSCLARLRNRPHDILRDELMAFIASKPCLSVAWRRANLDEHVETTPPACLVTRGVSNPEPATLPETSTNAPAHTASWDAKDLGCGELILELRRRIEALPAGSIFLLTATDPGGPEDLPAWCRMTGHVLESIHPPHYRIRRRS